MKLSGSNLKEYLLDLLFPKICVICNKEGAWICDHCLSLLKPKLNNECPVCRRSQGDVCVCDGCQEKSFLSGLWILADYDSAIQKIVQAVKYEFLTDLVWKLNVLAENYFSLNHWQKDFLLLPVPLAKKRYLSRGFNQARLIADMLGGVLGSKVVGDVLKRKKFLKPQVELSAKKRLENVKNNFQIKDSSLKDEKIVLVDDVYTTGATMNECARILKENGFQEVRGLVLARG